MKKSMLISAACAMLFMFPPFGGIKGGCQNIGISTDGSTPETGVLLDVKGINSKTVTATQNIFQIKSFDASTEALKLRLGLATNATYSLSYGIIDVPEYVGNAVSAYRHLVLQPSGGNVGIGTTSPAALFHVAADKNTTYDSSFVVTSAGRVGIGTSSPGNNLTVYANDANVGIGITNTSSSVLRYPYLTITNYNGGLGSHPYFGFQNAEGSSAAPTAVTTTSTTLLGTLIFSGYNGSSFIQSARIEASLDSNFTATRAPSHIRFSTGGTISGSSAYSEKMRIDKNGNVGIGCTGPQYKLHVIGDIASSATIRGVNAYVQGAITACSDIRYKKDITPLPNALNNVMKLQGVNYFWKTKEFPDKKFTEAKQLGFIAQEIEKIYPEVVMTDKDGYKSVDYSRLTPVLVEAMKEQQKIIDSQQSAIGSLQTENKNLKAEVEKIKEYLQLSGKK